MCLLKSMARPDRQQAEQSSSQTPQESSPPSAPPAMWNSSAINDLSSLGHEMDKLQYLRPQYWNECVINLDKPNETPDVVDNLRLGREEAMLEDMIVDLIVGGHLEVLQPNSGKVVAIGNHHVCVSSHQEPGYDYRTWEWHGHMMLYHEGEGYVSEYTFGSFLQPLEEAEDPPRAGTGTIFELGGFLGETE